MSVQQETVADSAAKRDLPAKSRSETHEVKPPSNKSQALIAEFQERLQHTIDAFKQTAAKQIADELPKVAEGLVKRSAQEFQRLAVQAGADFKEEMRAAGAEVSEETRKQFGELARSALDSLRSEASTASANALKEMTAVFEQRVQEACQNTDAALRPIHDAAEEAVTRLKAAADGIQSSLIDEHRRRIDELFAAGVKNLEPKAQRYFADFEQKLESALGAFKREAAEQLDAELSKTAASFVERCAGQLQKQADTQTERLLERLRSSGTAVVEDAKHELGGAEQSSLESFVRTSKSASEKTANAALKEVEERTRTALSVAVEKAVGRFEEAKHKVLDQAARAAEEHQKRLANLSTQSLEDSGRRMDQQAEAFRQRLEAEMKTVAEKSLEEMKREFPGIANGIIDQASTEIRKQADAAADRAQGELSKSASSIAEKARKELLGETQSSLQSLQETAVEQYREQVRQAEKDLIKENRKRLEAELDESLKKYRKRAQGQLEDLTRLSMERIAQAGPQLESVPVAARSTRTGRVATILGALAPTLLFLYFVSRPMMRLKTEPPADFLTVTTDWSAHYPDVSTELATAYWDWAALHLAPQYPYGSHLPKQPPIGFDVSGKNFPSGVDADLARMTYWQELRKLWVQPQSWDKVEVWNRQ